MRMQTCLLGSRFAAGLLAAVLACICSSDSADAQCINYEDFLHWTAGVDTPGSASAVAASGTCAYVADGDSGLQVVDILDPESPRAIGSIDTPGHATALAVAGSYVYIADGQSGLQVIDLTDAASPRIVGSVDTPGNARSVAIAGGHAYVADADAGLQVIDIADPSSPQIVASLVSEFSARAVVVEGSFAHLVESFDDDGFVISALTVIDVSSPANPRVVGKLDFEEEVSALAISGTDAYLVGDSGLLVVNISDPASPQFVCGATVWSSPEAVTVSGSYLYVASRGLDIDLTVFDITNPEGPREVGNVDAPGDGTGVAVAGSHAYLTTDDAGLQVIDVANPASPPRVGRAGIHYVAMAVAVSGTYAYLLDNWRKLTVIDFADPAQPHSVGSVRVPIHAYRDDCDLAVDGNHVYVAAGSGLAVVDVTDPLQPSVVGTVSTPGQARAVAVSRSYAYVSGYETGLQVIDISDPVAPRVVGNAALPSAGSSVAISGTHAYVACPFDGLRVVDVADPTNPSVVGGVAMPGGPRGVVVAGCYAYVATAHPGLTIVDIADSVEPQVVSAASACGAAGDVAVSGTHAYVGAHLKVIDISDVHAPRRIGSYPMHVGWTERVVVSGMYVFLACYPEDFLILPLECEPPPPVLVTELEANPSDEGVRISWQPLPDCFSAFYIDRTAAVPPISKPVRLNPHDPIPEDGPWEFLDTDVLYGESYSYSLIGVGDCEQEHRFGPVAASMPVPVLIAKLEAVPAEGGIWIHWQPAPNYFVAFYVERVDVELTPADYVRLNPDDPVSGSGPWKFLDTGVRRGERYTYRLVGVTRRGAEECFGPVEASFPFTRAALRAAFPNPTCTGAWIACDLPAPTQLTISIHDLTGRLVATVIQDRRDEGSHTIRWDGLDGKNREVMSGVYYVTMETASGIVGHLPIILTR